MVGLLPRLFHLTPPVTRTEAIVTRFAPLQASPERFLPGAQPRHHRSYDCLFSAEFLVETGFDLDDYAYYFERYFDYAEDAPARYWSLTRQIDLWKRQHREREVMLSWRDDGGAMLVTDTRRAAEPVLHRLEGLDRAAYAACLDRPASRRGLIGATGAPQESLAASLARLDAAGLTWSEGDLTQGLAIAEPVADAHRARGWAQGWSALYA